jgi:hypothetical protein
MCLNQLADATTSVGSNSGSAGSATLAATMQISDGIAGHSDTLRTKWQEAALCLIAFHCVFGYCFSLQISQDI